MPTSGIEVTGIKEFRRELKALGPEWPKELRAVHKHISDTGARDSQAAARGLGGVQRKAASTIKGRANQREARISVSGMRGLGNVAFWGAKKRTGWYAAERYDDIPRQHPVWVGNSWDVAVPGQGPYAINNTLARNLKQYLDRYGEMIDRLAAEAFPER